MNQTLSNMIKTIAAATILQCCAATAADIDGDEIVGVTTSDNAQLLSYVVVDQRITDVLDMIARDTSNRIVVSDAVRGRVQRKRLSGTSDDILNKLSASYGLDVFSQSGTIYVSSKRETAIRLVRLGKITRSRALSAFAEAGITFNITDARQTADGTALMLGGPPRKLALAEAVVESMPRLKPVLPKVKEVRIRRGVSLQVGGVSNTTENLLASQGTTKSESGSEAPVN